MLEILKRYHASGKALAAEKPILDKLIHTEEARAHAAFSLGTSHAFLRVERVIPETPQDLFGSPVPSRAHNRISVHAAPGETAMFSALVTETGLAMMTMSMNRSDDPAEMTLESVNGKRLSAADMTEMSPEDQMIHHVSAECVSRNKNNARKTYDLLSALKRPLGNADASDLAKTVSRGFAFGEGAFFASVYKEGENRRAALTRSEASNLVKCAHLLGDPDPEDASFRFEPEDVPEMSVLVRRSSTETAVRARATAHEMMRMAADAGLNDYDPRQDPKGKKLAGAFSWGSADAKRAERMGESLTFLLRTPAADIENRQADPRHLIGEMSRISGSMPLHSDSGADSHGYVSLRLFGAEVNYDYGKRTVRQRTGVPFFEVMITPTDLMMALRGDPDGDVWTRCSLNSAFGHHVPFVPYVHPLDSQIEEARIVETPLNKAQAHIGQELSELISSTRLKSAKDRAEAMNLAKTLLDGTEAANAEGLEQLRSACGMVSDHVDTELREGLQKMLRGRHAAALASHGGLDLLSGPTS